MIRSKAIAAKCLDCSGGSPMEVTLCHIVDCTLWEYRFGYSMESHHFDDRMKRMKKRSPKDFAEMLKMLRDYPQNIPNKNVKRYVATLIQKNSEKMTCDTRKQPPPL